MKRRFIILIALVMAATISIPKYASADTSNTGSNASSSSVTTTTTSDQGSGQQANPETINLSLDDALARVEKNNNEIILLDKEIEIYDKQYQQELARQQDMKGHESDTMEEDDMKVLKLNAPLAKANLDNAKNDRDDKLKSVKVDITDQYESILTAQMNMDNINEQIVNLQTTMDQINLKIKIGLAKASDIEQYKAQMATLQSNLSSQQRSIDTSMITLKQDLGVNLSAKVNLTSKPFDYIKFDDTNIDGKIQKAVDGSYDIIKQKQDIENTKIQYDIFRKYSDSQEDSTEISIEDKQATLDSLPTTLEVQFKTAYNNLKSLEDAVEAEKLSVESCQITLNTAEANYKLGNISYLDLLNSRLALSKEKNTLQQDINAYMKASKDFENSLN